MRSEDQSRPDETPGQTNGQEGPLLSNLGPFQTLSGPSAVALAESPDGAPKGPEKGPDLLDNRGKFATSCSDKGLWGKKYPEELDEFTSLRESQESDHQRRLERYARAVTEGQRMADWLASEVGPKPSNRERPEVIRKRKVHRKLATCGSQLFFDHYLETGNYRLAGGVYCQQERVCQFCALRVGGRMLRYLAEKVRTALDDDPTLTPYLVTVTVKDGKELKERFDHLRRALAQQVSRANKRRNHGRGKRTVLESWQGWFRKIEIKRGKNSGLWHPHCHSAVLARSEPDAKQLAAEWKELTGDSWVVDVRPFHSVENGCPTEELAQDLLEVCKYLTKFSELEPHDIWEVFQVTRRKHLQQSYGCLRFTAEEMEQVNKAADDPEDGPFIRILYEYHNGTYEAEGHYLKDRR